MANKQIYELNNAGNDLDNSALLAMDIPNPDSSAASEIPYVTRKASINVLENQFLGEDEYTTELNTENQTIFGSINEVLTYAKNIAEEYDDTATYAIGDFVTYEGVLYKCIVAIAVAESWDSTHWDSTLIVEEFGSGGGGASVTLGTTTPSDASGSNGDLYVQYDGVSYAAVYAYVKINNSWRKFPYAKVVALTQAEYDLITPDPSTLYIITDAQSSYQTKTDNSLATTDKTVVGAINELNSGKVDLTPIELTFNPHSNITIFRNQSFKIGKLVILSCILKVEGNIANGDIILTSLPTMAKMSGYQGRLRFPKIIGNDEYYGTPSEGLNISDNTTVLTNFGAITATSANPKYIFVNVNYVTSD